MNKINAIAPGLKLIITVWAFALSMACASAWALDANTLPSGGAVTAGSGTISQGGSTMTVDRFSVHLTVFLYSNTLKGLQTRGK